MLGKKPHRCIDDGWEEGSQEESLHRGRDGRDNNIGTEVDDETKCDLTENIQL